MLSYHLKEPTEKKTSVTIIWLHGLGASSADLMPILSHSAFKHLPISHLFLDAPIRPVTLNGGVKMQAWFDVTGIPSPVEDEQGILHSRTLIQEIISKRMADGIKSQNIIVAGFSQGGAMALDSALNFKAPLGGVIALSAWLPTCSIHTPQQPKTTPFFIGLGQFDTIVLPEWTQKSALLLEQHGFAKIARHEYPMEHTLCIDEISAIAAWISKYFLHLSKA